MDENEAPVEHAETPQRLARSGIAASRVLGLRPRGTRQPLRWLRFNAKPVVLSDGRRTLAVTVVQDVTQARREAIGRQFLLEAGPLLASSLDYEATLASVARLAVPRLADWCSVQVVGEDGVARTVAITHVDPARVAVVRKIHALYPEDPDAPRGPPNVRRTGIPEVHNDLTDEILVASARDDEHCRLIRELRLAAVMFVPMRARGRVVGVLSFASSESGVRFDAEDLAVATKLADRAALAIENARLYTAAEASRARLSEERERLHVTLSSIGDAVIATDRDGRVTMLNPVATALTGWAPEDAVGRPLAEVFPIFSEKTGLPVKNPVEKVLHTGKIVGLANHTALADRDGNRRAIADSAAPIRAADGTVVGVVLVFRDVTQEQRLERELAKASKLESIGVLAGGIAHDFNNILTSISANISLAERRLGMDNPAKGRLSAAQVACERARDLTRQLLTFSRGGAPIRSATSVRATLQEACGFALQGSSVRAHYDLPADVWPIDADAGQIGQVVHNIALNAVQAMPAGGNLRLAAENVSVDEPSWLPLAPGTYVRVSVSDDGPGIAPENLPRIFDPFFTTKASGSGLGLATAYSIVKRHDGHLGVESVLGAGTTFTLYLPAAAESPRVAACREPAEGGRGRILVMDDDEAIRDLTRECLADLGYECEAASDGGEAIERYVAAQAAGRPFDVLMLDLTVPGGLGGRETLRRLKER
ncbi:MAG: ATP-binding protein, partial [Myxococcota bacterium]